MLSAPLNRPRRLKNDPTVRGELSRACHSSISTCHWRGRPSASVSSRDLFLFSSRPIAGFRLNRGREYGKQLITDSPERFNLEPRRPRQLVRARALRQRRCLPSAKNLGADCDMQFVNYSYSK
jgi:hypothetical protein